MSEKLISRRGAFSLLGLTAALGFAVPATMLTESDAEAQMQPTAPAPTAPAPSAPAPTTPATGMQQGQEQQTGGKKRRQARHSGRTKRREARHTGRTGRREARQTSRTGRREARGKSNNLYMKSDTTKQK
jgi:hypothetical protein